MGKGYLWTNVLLSHRQKYVDPSDKEGFTEIVQVNFVPEFKDDEQEKLYHSHLLES